MNIRSLSSKSVFAFAVVAASLVIFSTGDAEARRGAGGPGYHRPGGSPPPLASAHTTVRPHSVVSGCSTGRRCVTPYANGGVVVTNPANLTRPGRR
jgi:hypothetical protein